MSIEVQCPNCSETVMAKDALAGKRIKCPSCGERIIVAEAPIDEDFDEENEQPGKNEKKKKKKKKKRPKQRSAFLGFLGKLTSSPSFVIGAVVVVALVVGLVLLFARGSAAERAEKVKGLEEGTTLGSLVRAAFVKNQAQMDKDIQSGNHAFDPFKAHRHLAVLDQEKRVVTIVPVEWTTTDLGRYRITETGLDNLAKGHVPAGSSEAYTQGFREGLDDGYYATERAFGSLGKVALYWVAAGIPVMCLVAWYFKRRFA